MNHPVNRSESGGPLSFVRESWPRRLRLSSAPASSRFAIEASPVCVHGLNEETEKAANRWRPFHDSIEVLALAGPAAGDVPEKKQTTDEGECQSGRFRNHLPHDTRTAHAHIGGGNRSHLHRIGVAGGEINRAD